MSDPIISARVPQEFFDRFNSVVNGQGEPVRGARQEAIVAALRLYMAQVSAPVLPMPTEAEKATKRLQVLAVLRDGQEHTPAEIARRLGYGEAFIGAASAYCRDLKKPKFGAYPVIGAKREGGYTYRLALPIKEGGI